MDPLPAGRGGEPTRFFFVHLQKAAGTSLFIAMRHHFGEQAVYPMPEYERHLDTSFSVDLLRERFERHRAQIRVIAGHFPLGAVELLDAPFTVFTVLRDPVERTLSYLRQQEQQVEDFRGRPLEKIYEDPWRRAFLLTNYMVRNLALSGDDLRTVSTMSSEALLAHAAPDDEALLERAKHNLTHCVDLVGVQEQLDDFRSRLAERYGWDLGEPVRANTTTEMAVSDELRMRIAEDNWADVELYRYVVDTLLTHQH